MRELLADIIEKSILLAKLRARTCIAPMKNLTRALINWKGRISLPRSPTELFVIIQSLLIKHTKLNYKMKKVSIILALALVFITFVFFTCALDVLLGGTHIASFIQLMKMLLHISNFIIKILEKVELRFGKEKAFFPIGKLKMILGRFRWLYRLLKALECCFDWVFPYIL